MLKFLTRLRTHTATRYTLRAAAITVVLLAATVVSTLTVDLGPAVKQLAEREGSRRIERPVRIGRLAIHLLRGRVVLEDVFIDGVSAGDRPFFTAESALALTRLVAGSSGRDRSSSSPRSS